MYAGFKAFMIKTTRDSFSALSVKVEEDLLVQSNHFYLISKLEKQNPWKGKLELCIKNLLKLRRLKVCDEIFDIKELIEEEVHKTLYNRACLKQEMFRTYEIIRSIANRKYN